MIQDCKKFQCPAKVVMEEIIQFPEYKKVQIYMFK